MALPKTLITGANGMLARALTHAVRSDGSEVVALTRDELDVTNSAEFRRALLRHRPKIVIQGAAFTRVDDAETQEQLAFDVNAFSVITAAAVCREIGARLVYPSTDYVFDGKARRPYTPDSATAPINTYGRSKLAGEQASKTAGDYLVVRTAWLYGTGGRNFVRTIVSRLVRGEKLRVVNDQRGTPTWTNDLAYIVVQLLRSSAPPGVYHATNQGEATWFDLARAIAQQLGYSRAIQPCATAEYPTSAPRPFYSVLNCDSTQELVGGIRDWRLALREALNMSGY